MRLIDHLKPEPVSGTLDAVQFVYFALIIVSCETELQCNTMRDWVQRTCGHAEQFTALLRMIDERRAEIAGQGYYVTTTTN